jgi:hypothetical protein
MSKKPQAEVEVTANKAPVLHPGSLTPEILRHFENACRSFFRNKKIDAKDQVASIAGNMLDIVISDWYWTSEARINQLSFNDFLKEMKEMWLKKDWEKDVCRRVLGTKQNSCDFWEWSVEIRGLNALLRDLPGHLTEANLRNQLEANMDKALQVEIDDKKANEIKEFEKWLARVKELDERLRRDRVQAKADAEEAARTAFMKRSSSTAGFLEPSRKYNANPAKIRESSAPALTATTEQDKPKRLAKLTTEERAVLRANNGCFKCRRFNAGHLAKDCPWDARGSTVQPGQYNGSQKPVAAVVDKDTDAFEGGSLKSFPHAEVVATSSFPIAAVLPPPNESRVLLDGDDDSEHSVSDPICCSSFLHTCDTPLLPISSLHSCETLPCSSLDDVEVIPLSVPHLRWRAAIVDENPEVNR